MANGIDTGSAVYCILFYLFIYSSFVLFYFILIHFRFLADEQNLMLYMRQMVFAYIFIQGWIVDPYEY